MLADGDPTYPNKKEPNHRGGCQRLREDRAEIGDIRTRTRRTDCAEHGEKDVVHAPHGRQADVSVVSNTSQTAVQRSGRRRAKRRTSASRGLI